MDLSKKYLQEEKIRILQKYNCETLDEALSVLHTILAKLGIDQNV